METNYALPRCTYVELHNAAGEHIYTITKADCARLKVIPFAVENFAPMDEQYAKALKAMLKLQYGHMSEEQAKLYYNISTNYAGGATFRDGDGNSWTLAGLMDMAQTRVYLTAGGVELIRDLSGVKRAYDISGMELYALNPLIQVEQNVVTSDDPEPDGGQTKKQENNSLLNKLLLLVAGWALFN